MRVLTIVQRLNKVPAKKNETILAFELVNVVSNMMYNVI